MNPKNMLIGSVTFVLLVLLLTVLLSAQSLPFLVFLTVLIIEVVLIMTIGGAARHLPGVLRTILKTLVRWRP